MPHALCPRRKKIVYRSQHRGTREADLLLGPWAVKNASLWHDNDLDVVESFLEQQDVDIYDWLVGAHTPPAAYVQIIETLQSHD